MLQRDGHPAALGEALAAVRPDLQDRCTSSAYIDADETYRRDIKRHPQPAGRPPRPGPRPCCHGTQGRAAPPLRARPRGPARRPRPRPELRRAVDHRLPRTPPITPAPRPGLPGASGRTCRPALARSCSTAPRRPRHLPASPCPTWPPAPSASSATPTPPMTMRSYVLPDAVRSGTRSRNFDPGSPPACGPAVAEVAARGRSKALPRPRRIGRVRTEPPRCWLVTWRGSGGSSRRPLPRRRGCGLRCYA